MTELQSKEHEHKIGELIDDAVYTYDGYIQRRPNHKMYLQKIRNYGSSNNIGLDDFDQLLRKVLKEKGLKGGIREFVDEIYGC